VPLVQGHPDQVGGAMNHVTITMATMWLLGSPMSSKCKLITALNQHTTVVEYLMVSELGSTHYVN